ncbi:MAG: DUF2271 domain-containing protein [Bacteroidota bacterium]
MFFKRVESVVVILLIGLGTVLPGCNRSTEWILDISFQLNEREEYPRSDQLVIWLEKSDGTFVTTLFVSEYLSYGGYNHPEICPDWTVKTDWEEASQEDFDAATGATPSIGQVNLAFVRSSKQVPKGEYNIYIEVHLIEDYNELYTGKVRISGRKYSNLLLVSYKPDQYSKATYDVLSNVQVSINE